MVNIIIKFIIVYVHVSIIILLKHVLQKPLIIKGRPILRSKHPLSLSHFQKKLSESKELFNVFVTENRMIEDHDDANNLANYKIEHKYKGRHVDFNGFMSLYDELRKAENSSRVYLQVRA